MIQQHHFKKIQSKHTLQWCLKVGGYTGTLNEQQVRQSLKISKAQLRKWMHGITPVPTAAITRVKKLAFSPYRLPLNKPLISGYANTQETIDTFEATAQWKWMLWDAMHQTTKQRFFRRYVRDLLIHQRAHV